jgi:protein ImuB
MKRNLCLWMPDWPIQRLRVCRPELASKLIVLHTRIAQRGLCVSTCCQASRSLGISPGMTLSEAQSLLRHGAKPQKATSRQAGPQPKTITLDWHIEPHDPAADLQLLRELAWLCERHSPLVGIEEGDQPQCLLLDASHLGPRNVPEQLWLGELLGEFSQQGFCLRAGLADTVGLAWAIAHYGSYQENISAIVPPGFSLHQLKNFPLAALRLDPQVLDLLHQLDVATIGAFLKLPREGLATRFGPKTLRRLDQATGKEPEVFNAYRPTPPWRERKLLEHQTSDRDILGYALQQLLFALSQSLKAKDLGVMELTCRFDGSTKPATAVRVALFRPTVDAVHLFKLVHLQLENLTFPEPIENVSVEAMRTARLEEHQAQFWHTPGSLMNSPRLRGMIERMASRLGTQRVSRVRLRHDAQPEYAFVHEPLTGASGRAHPMAPKTKRRSSQKRSAAGEEVFLSEGQIAKASWRVLERPLFLFSPPKEIDVTAIAPEGPPARFRWQGQWRRIMRHWGPERIDVGWHRGPSVRRDYYRVETDDGQRAWLFQDRIRGGWKLHGFFS